MRNRRQTAPAGIPKSANLAGRVVLSPKARAGPAPEEAGSMRGPPLMEVIDQEDRLRRAKYLGALADRLFRDECVRLGLDADEAIRSPLMSIITRQGGPVVTPRTSGTNNP